MERDKYSTVAHYTSSQEFAFGAFFKTGLSTKRCQWQQLSLHAKAPVRKMSLQKERNETKAVTETALAWQK